MSTDGTTCISAKETEKLQQYLRFVKAEKSGAHLSQGIYLSAIHNLSLLEFIMARKLYCKMQGHGKWEGVSRKLRPKT